MPAECASQSAALLERRTVRIMTGDAQSIIWHEAQLFVVASRLYALCCGFLPCKRLLMSDSLRPRFQRKSQERDRLEKHLSHAPLDCI